MLKSNEETDEICLTAESDKKAKEKKNRKDIPGRIWHFPAFPENVVGQRARRSKLHVLIIINWFVYLTLYSKKFLLFDGGKH